MYRKLKNRLLFLKLKLIFYRLIKNILPDNLNSRIEESCKIEMLSILKETNICIKESIKS